MSVAVVWPSPISLKSRPNVPKMASSDALSIAVKYLHHALPIDNFS